MAYNHIPPSCHRENPEKCHSSGMHLPQGRLSPTLGSSLFSSTNALQLIKWFSSPTPTPTFPRIYTAGYKGEVSQTP